MELRLPTKFSEIIPSLLRPAVGYWCYYRHRKAITHSSLRYRHSKCVWLSVTLRRDAWERKNTSLRGMASVCVRPPERECAHMGLRMHVCVLKEEKQQSTREKWNREVFLISPITNLTEVAFDSRQSWDSQRFRLTTPCFLTLLSAIYTLHSQK